MTQVTKTIEVSCLDGHEFTVEVEANFCEKDPSVGFMCDYWEANSVKMLSASVFDEAGSVEIAISDATMAEKAYQSHSNEIDSAIQYHLENKMEF